MYLEKEEIQEAWVNSCSICTFFPSCFNEFVQCLIYNNLRSLSSIIDVFKITRSQNDSGGWSCWKLLRMIQEGEVVGQLLSPLTRRIADVTRWCNLPRVSGKQLDKKVKLRTFLPVSPKLNTDIISSVWWLEHIIKRSKICILTNSLGRLD